MGKIFFKITENFLRSDFNNRKKLWLIKISDKDNCQLVTFFNSIVKSIKSISHIQTFLFSSLYLISFHQGIQRYHRKFKKIYVNVPKSHLSLQYNFKKNTLWNIKKISHSNDEFVEPTSYTEAIFDIIGTLGTVQPWNELTFLFQYMSSVWQPVAPLLREIKICIHCTFCNKILFWTTLDWSIFQYNR